MIAKSDPAWISKIKNRFERVIKDEDGQFAHIALRVTVGGYSTYEELLYHFEDGDAAKRYLKESDRYFMGDGARSKGVGTVMNKATYAEEEDLRKRKRARVRVPAEFFVVDKCWHSVRTLGKNPNRYSSVKAPAKPGVGDARRASFRHTLETHVTDVLRSDSISADQDESPTIMRRNVRHFFDLPAWYKYWQGYQLNGFAACIAKSHIKDINDPSCYGYGVAMYYVARNRSLDLESEVMGALSTWLVELLNQQSERIKSDNDMLKKHMTEVAQSVFSQRNKIQVAHRMLNDGFGVQYLRVLEFNPRQSGWLPELSESLKDIIPEDIQASWSDLPGHDLFSQEPPWEFEHNSVLPLVLVLYKADDNLHDLDAFLRILCSKHWKFNLEEDQIVAVATGFQTLLRTGVFTRAGNKVTFSISSESLQIAIELPGEDDIWNLDRRVRSTLRKWASSEIPANLGNATESVCNLMGVDFCNAPGIRDKINTLIDNRELADANGKTLTINIPCLSDD